MAEIIRGGIQSIDAGQSEAAKSLGMTTFQTMDSIIFPQAIKNTISDDWKSANRQHQRQLYVKCDPGNRALLPVFFGSRK